MLGAYICLSTMAAAALGNTFSDVIGIGSAYYVERFAERIGFKPPNINPIQLDMPISRRIANMVNENMINRIDERCLNRFLILGSSFRHHIGLHLGYVPAALFEGSTEADTRYC